MEKIVNMRFEELKIRPEIVRALNENEIVEPTGIQEKSIPLIKSGKDVIGMSKTGSGKTASFGIPVLEKVEKGKGVQALILSPTRELAVQISKEMQKFGRYLDVKIATVFGGVSLGPQAERIAKSEIVVGTPGRVLDHLGRGNLNLSKLKIFTLDEADKMVDMGFIEDVERILKATPREKQVLLFGATLSEEINYLKRKHMRDPVIAKAESHVQEEFLEQYYYDVSPNEKFSLLVHLLKQEETQRVIIFCSTRATVELLSRNLNKHGIRVEMIHGKLNQNKRLKVIDQFHKGEKTILVASTVAARGLDIKDVTHVFNYDLSRDPQEYIHRIGRTARAGEAGKAITLLGPNDHAVFNSILTRYPVKVAKLDKGNFEKLRFEARQRQGGRFNSRHSHSGRGNGRYHSDDRDNSRFSRQEHHARASRAASWNSAY